MENRDPAAPTTPYKIDNPEEFARNMLRLFEEGGRAMFGTARALGRQDQPLFGGERGVGGGEDGRRHRSASG